MCIETKTSMVDVPVQVVFKVGLVNMVFFIYGVCIDVCSSKYRPLCKIQVSVSLTCNLLCDA